MVPNRWGAVITGAPMKRILLVAALAAVATAAFAADLVIRNQSHWDIHRIYLSSTDSDEWGEDQLDDDILKSGQTLTLTGVTCDYYDVKLVDEDGDTCELRDVKLCGDKVWNIDDDELLGCERDE
jgi:opacity protein-like surface antigen